MSTKVVAAVLAAGSSSRFGSPKQLAKIGKKSLIDIPIDALEGAGLEHIGVVLGANFEAINEYLPKRNNSTGIKFHTLRNLDWNNGLSSSIQTATKFAIAEDATHLLLLACDQPFVSSALLQRLLMLVNEATHKVDIVACKYENSAGIPAIFPAIYFDDLLKLEGDKGAKSIILKSKAPVLVEFPRGSRDVDLVEDLDGIEAELVKD